MDHVYTYEPARLEIVITELIGNTLAKSYYYRLVRLLDIETDDKVLDYCSGSGILSKMISRQIKNGKLVFTDVSDVWLTHAAKKLKHCKNSSGVKLSNCSDEISGGLYDRILVHYAIHDFPREYRLSIINQLVKNLRPQGRLYIREPIGGLHGIELYELINLLEHTKHLLYEYQVKKSRILGEYIDVISRVI